MSKKDKKPHNMNILQGHQDSENSAAPQEPNTPTLTDPEKVSRRRFLTYSAGVAASLYFPLAACSENGTGPSTEGTQSSAESGTQHESAPTESPIGQGETPQNDAGEGLPEISPQEPNIPEPDIFRDEPFSTEGTIEKAWAELTPEEKPTPFTPQKDKEEPSVFPYGVQAGGMRSTSAIVWTYIADKQIKTLKVWRPGPTPDTVYMDENSVINPNPDGYFKASIKNLKPGSWYQFAFFDNKGGRSSIGRFRTAFAPGVLAPLTLGGTTCTKNTYAPFESLELLAKENIDLFVHLGDMSYNDSAKTLDEYRKMWRGVIKSGGYKELLHRTGYYITWDDHEIDNNFNPETMDKKRLAAGKKAYFETLPVEQGPNNRLWNSYLWGNTAEIFLLDSRSERKPSTRRSKKPVYIGEAQMKWLKERLAKSPAHFKILMNSVPMTNMPPLWLSSSDRWEGYKVQREELLNHISDNNIKNVWFLSGDFHVGFVSKLEKSGKWSNMYEIAVGPGDSYPNPFGFAIGGLRDRLIFPKNQFLFGTGSRKNTTTLTFDPKNDTVHVKFVDAVKKKVLFDKKLKQS